MNTFMFGYGRVFLAYHHQIRVKANVNKIFSEYCIFTKSIQEGFT